MALYVSYGVSKVAVFDDVGARAVVNRFDVRGNGHNRVLKRA